MLKIFQTCDWLSILFCKFCCCWKVTRAYGDVPFIVFLLLSCVYRLVNVTGVVLEDDGEAQLAPPSDDDESRLRLSLPGCGFRRQSLIFLIAHVSFFKWPSFLMPISSKSSNVNCKTWKLRKINTFQSLKYVKVPDPWLNIRLGNFPHIRRDSIAATKVERFPIKMKIILDANKLLSVSYWFFTRPRINDIHFMYLHC